MSLIDASVRAIWCSWTRQFEGRVAWLYQDVRGLVTIGLGCLVDPVERALELPLRHGGGALATPEEIRDDWMRVKALEPAKAPGHYDSVFALYLRDADVDELALRRLEADAAVLERFWPDFAELPPSAQQALLSMAWALGAGAERPGLTSPEWPHLQAAITAHDWATAAAECTMRSPGVDDRNAANKALFLAAVR